MSTFMANKGNIVRKWYVVDAAGKPLGHTAVVVADLLRGKRKPTYQKETKQTNKQKTYLENELMKLCTKE